MAISLYEFGQSIVQIREAVNAIEHKGRQNSAYVVFVSNKCDELIAAINEAAKREGKEGDADEQDPG